MLKKCNKCEKEQYVSEFANGPIYKGKQYLRGECKTCQSLYRKADKYKETQKRTRSDEEYKEKRKLYRKLPHVVAKELEYENGRKVIRLAQKKARHNIRYKNEVLYKLKILCRNRVNKLTKIKLWTKTGKLDGYLGCTPDELRAHLESKFQGGMTWENHGKWHIDHIIPLSSANTAEEMYKLCHYTNTQPLWAHDNLVKQDKIIQI